MIILIIIFYLYRILLIIIQNGIKIKRLLCIIVISKDHIDVLDFNLNNEL